jgi:D-alanyl-D-alanine carboxypeptidase/D-alanyl-D-alanine-endopeptidase (penicillin-binding protein 4)
MILTGRRGAVGLLFLSLALAGLLGSVPAAQAIAPQEGLARKVLAELRSAGGGSGAWIAEADGKQLFSLLPEVKRTPASLQKLLTTSTALARFGERDRLRTVVRADGVLADDGTLDGDLYIQGFGDPSFGGSDLGRLAARVGGAGVGRVSGRVYGDESYFDSRRGLPAGGFRLSVDVGPLSALSFNEGSLAPYGRGFQADPARFVAERLRAALVARGIDVPRAARTGKAPTTNDALATVHSPAIGALVRHMNQVSDNYYAETLLKGLGARFSGSGSTAAGATVVKRFQASLGVTGNVLDGSGLSRGDAVSPRAIGRVLTAARGEPWFDSFYRSLPLAGRTGTLRKRMRGTAAQGRCRAKTGTLIGVSALAGYCRSRANRPIAFALLMNGVNVARARAAQDRIAAALAAYSGN